MIRAAAPGKVVLWGEYAVLAGAPALVIAVDRYAHCDLQPGGELWRCDAPGYSDTPDPVSREQLLGGEPPPVESAWRLAWHALQTLDCTSLPRGGRARFDTRDFHLTSPGRPGRKLGLGSSAALCVAIYAAFARLLGHPPAYSAALEAHRHFQGGAGSGIDVAAAWQGGTLKFRRPKTGGTGEAVPWPLPNGMEPAFVFTGEAASTIRHLERFRRWRDGGGGDELEALCEAAAGLFERNHVMHALPDYIDALRALDRAADLGIFSEAHRRLERLAFHAGVVYKPCGAGGGDIGAAFSSDAAATDRFLQLAAEDGFLPLALETAPHGIELTG